MIPATVAYTLLVILSSSVLENVDAQPPNSYDIIRSMASLTKAVGNLSRIVENLQAKVEDQAKLFNNLVTKEELQTLARNLEKQVEGQANLLGTLVNKIDKQATLLNTVGTDQEIQRQAMDLQTTALNNLVTKEELEATLLKILQSNVTTVGAELQRMSEDFRKSVASTRTVDGIIAGTQDSIVIIPLESGEQRKISNKPTYGVAFDWNTRKVYWLEEHVRIKRANLDGTLMELLISDTSTLYGLAVDPVTGNFYYGVRSPKNEIRVCNKNGQKCAVVPPGGETVGNDIYDIALYPSEGIMFWSYYDGRKIVRANMDGRNAKVVISEDIQGICIDEASQRLYGSQDRNRIISSYDLNGNNRKVLLSGSFDPRDVAVDGDTVYFGNDDYRSVYSLTTNGQLALISNTTAYVKHIALYGRHKVPSRWNPCHSSACPNVCVLNRDSFTCL